MGGARRVTAGQWAAAALPCAARGVGISPPPPEECQLFNMETAVARLEAMFQKAEADLDWIQHRLEYEIMKTFPDDTPPEDNPLAILEGLSAAKARYKALCTRMDRIAREQKEAMKGIQASVENTTKIVQELQQKAGLESLPLSAEEQAAAQQLGIQTGTEMESSVGKLGCAGSTVPGSAKGQH
ncbi:spindle and kinetochore-associated protein 2 isoform X2 [Manacus candei]|nr:spindle and kinetochore-associated protein 2 isoform X2 [Manacus candei]